MRDDAWLCVLTGGLFLVALVRVLARSARTARAESALRQQRVPFADPAPAPVAGAFPIVLARPDGARGNGSGNGSGNGAAGTARYRVTGVSRETGEPLELRVDAASPAHAAYKADLHRIAARAVERVGDDDEDGGAGENDGERDSDGGHDQESRPR